MQPLLQENWACLQLLVAAMLPKYLQKGQDGHSSCGEGEEGIVYEGNINFKETEY